VGVVTSSKTTTSTTMITTSSQNARSYCAAPTTTHGEFAVLSNSSWTLTCYDGRMPSGGNIVRCVSGVRLPKRLPTCVEGIRCKTANIRDLTFSIPFAGTSHVTGTTCDVQEDIAHGVTCTATCAANRIATGAIRCSRGKLQDESYCISPDSGITIEPVTQIFGELEVGFDAPPEEASLKAAICAAMFSGETCDYILKAVAVPILASFRLLASFRIVRRLAARYTIEYGVAVPASSTVDSMTAKALSFASSNSTTVIAFQKSLASNGVIATNVTQMSFSIVKSIIIKDASGRLIRSNSSQKSGQAAPIAVLAGESSSGLIISILIGSGAVAGSILLAVCCGFLLMHVGARRRHQAHQKPCAIHVGVSHGLPVNPALQLGGPLPNGLDVGEPADGLDIGNVDVDVIPIEDQLDPCRAEVEDISIEIPSDEEIEDTHSAAHRTERHELTSWFFQGLRAEVGEFSIEMPSEEEVEPVEDTHKTVNFAPGALNSHCLPASPPYALPPIPTSVPLPGRFTNKSPRRSNLSSEADVIQPVPVQPDLPWESQFNVEVGIEKPTWARQTAGVTARTRDVPRGQRRGSRVSACGDRFTIGQKVQRRDIGGPWCTGYVTSAAPLKVTVHDDPSEQGYSWDMVEALPTTTLMQENSLGTDALPSR